ncbi:proto-oncogene Mas-like [Hemicordylus capensis]|uniref:proto-oncogene Mas-like n=1 Tax=Hemicordylus capensis TaxID=884348 RepID=UPI00230261DE|nr:proto-oncogene Mas-like [Hemicordylus capensis]
MTESSSLSTHTNFAVLANETQKLNGTYRNSDVFTILIYVASPINLLGLIANGIVFRFLCCGIKRTKYTVYVLNLAIADFIVLFVHMTAFAASVMMSGTLDFTEYLYTTFDILSFFGYDTSLFLLTAISVERHLGVFYPLWYQYKRPKDLSPILCALLWVLSCLMTGVEYFSCWSEYISHKEQYSPACNTTTMFLSTIFLIFTPVMVICSLSLFVKIQLCQRHSQPKSPARLCLTIAVTVALFLIFVVPLRLHCLILYWYPKMTFDGFLFDIFCFLNLISCSLNPFAYFLVGRQKRSVREPLHVVLQRSWKEETK